MIKRYVIAVMVMLVALGAKAQETQAAGSKTIDVEAIKRAVLNTSSDLFYPKLFERYSDGDTTLSLKDYQHLYYGYIYEDRYRPLESNNYSDSLLMTLHRNQNDSLISPELFGQVEYYAKRVLESRPFDLNFINMLTYCYQKQGNIEMAEKYSYKLSMILETILSSGSGRHKESPWLILYREDANDILGFLGARYYKRLFISTTVEYFHLTDRVDGAKGYYFDISRLYLKKPERRIDPNAKRKMEFNPKYNPKSDQFLSPDVKY